MSVPKFETQRELFIHIWINRSHYSEVSGEYLGEEPRAHYFSHVIGKGAYPSFKLREDNIVLMTIQEHEQWGNRRWEIENDPRWKWVFDREEELKEEHNKKAPVKH